MREKHTPYFAVNLTILDLPAYADLPDFFAAHHVEMVCALPHYRQLNIDAQRGDGVFEKSIAGLRKLNAAGYRQPGTGLRPVLVTKPVGAYLPGGQASLEREWKRELGPALRHPLRRAPRDHEHADQPLPRMADRLVQPRGLHGAAGHQLQPRRGARGDVPHNTLSVGWDGTLYDCDFNQMLDLTLKSPAPRHIADFDLAALEARAIVTGRHCFGCTAGAGSS